MVIFGKAAVVVSLYLYRSQYLFIGKNNGRCDVVDMLPVKGVSFIRINCGGAGVKAKSEKEAINYVLRRFDADIQLAEATLSLAGKMRIENVLGD